MMFITHSFRQLLTPNNKDVGRSLSVDKKLRLEKKLPGFNSAILIKSTNAERSAAV